MTDRPDRPLTEKETAFVTAYTTPGAATYRDPSASAETAGYGSARNAGWRLLQRPSIIAAINAVERQHPADSPVEARSAAEATTDRDSVRAELEKVYKSALEKKDYSTAARCQELIGKTVGAFDERSDPERHEQLTAAQQEWADKLTMLIVSGKTAVEECPNCGRKPT